jgi:hypothetical protein
MPAEERLVSNNLYVAHLYTTFCTLGFLLALLVLKLSWMVSYATNTIPTTLKNYNIHACFSQ